MKLLSSLTLTLILAVSVYGGDMQNPAPQPPPERSAQVSEPSETEAQTATIIETVMSILGLL